MIQIRKAIPSDTDGIEKLYSDVCDHLEAHENFPGWKKGIYPAREDAENGIKYGSLFSVLENGEIIASFMLDRNADDGYSSAVWLTESDYARIYVLHTLAVRPDRLQRGIGTKILEYAESFAKKERCLSIRLDIVHGNTPAEKLYRKNGYEFIATVSLGREEYGLPWFDLYEKVL